MRRLRLLVVLAVLLVLRLWVDNCTVRTKEYDVYCGVPAGFEGLRIAQISDLHGCERLYEALLRHTRDARPDLIFLTGDIIDGEDQWPKLEELLRALTGIAPCYYVSGNHEWADLEPEPAFRRIAETGVRVLRNEWVMLERSGDLVALAGFEDPNGYADMISPGDLCRLIRGSTDAFIIALAHRPGLFPQLAEGGCGLVFSGHNHGGVIRLPFYGGLIPPARRTGEYDAGLFYRDGHVMLVSPGLTGTNGIPRFLNRPQLCLAILHPWN